jgi:hypothetical protein
MKTVKIFFFLLLSVCFSSKMYCQFFKTEFEYYSNVPIYYEAGVGIGVMNCITDVGGANGKVKYYLNEIRGKNFRPDISVYAGIVYIDYIAARLQGTMGQVRSADYDITGKSIYADYKRNRNLSFKSNITEVALLIDFRPLVLFDLEPKKWAPEPYLTLGIGWFSFNPQTQYNGRWVDLKPLHTEGQGFSEYPGVSNYKLSQVNIPLGIGLRYKLSPKFNIRLEYIHRKLFTDYLDDASREKFIDPALFEKYLSPAAAADARALYNRSLNGRTPPTRGIPKNNDTYMSLTLKLGVVLSRRQRL